MAKDDIIDVEPIEEEKVEEVADEEIEVEAKEEVEEESSNTKEAAGKVKDDIKDTTDHLKDEANKSKEKVKTEAKESAERIKEDAKRNAGRVREDAKRRREKFDENVDRGKDVAGKVSENLSKTFDDTIVALKTFQKDVDSRYQEYRETSATNKIDVDLVDAEDAYYLQAYIAGVEKEDIDIEATKNSLTIKVKFANIFDKIETPEDSEPKFIITAGKKGEASRTIKLSDDVDIDAVSAKQDNGLLLVTLPKIDIPKAKVDVE